MPRKRTTDEYQRTLCERPIKGWGAGRAILERCGDKERRELLAELLHHAGVQGAPAMNYTARLLRWLADGRKYPTPRKELRGHETRFCQLRAQELLKPYIGDSRLEVRLGKVADEEAR